MKRKSMALILPGTVLIAAFLLTFFWGFCFKKAAAAPVAESKNWMAPDLEAAGKRAQEVVPLIIDYKKESPYDRIKRLRDLNLGLKDVKQTFFLLDSPIIKKEKDLYEPVRFMHGQHATMTKDCTECHHFRPEDSNARETTRCSACHQKSFNPKIPERVGLKAAYHLNCMGCHQEMKKGPVGCIECHAKKVPDHKELVKLPKKPAPSQVTIECLRCHQDAGEDMLQSAHWLWRGPSPFTVNQEKQVQSGKGTNAINSY